MVSASGLDYGPDFTGGKSAVEVCQLAGVDPDLEITRFCLGDVACALLSAGWGEERVIRVLRLVNIRRLEDALCDASGWPEIFEEVCREAERR